MKRIILYVLLPAVLLASCKKDSVGTHDSNGKTYKVNFNLSGFTQVVTSANKNTTNSIKTNAAASSVIKVLYYLVFDSNNLLVRQIYQDSSSVNFGKITDNLSAGTYTIVFFGGQKGLNLPAVNNQYLSSTFGAKNTSWPYWKDTFSKKITLTVGSGDIDQDITLDRIVSQLTIKLLDVIPANAYSLVVSTSNDYDQFDFSTNLPRKTNSENKSLLTSRSQTIIIPASAKGKANYSNSFILLYDGTDEQITISIYDSSKKLIGQSKVPNVTVRKNTQTILSGYLFGSNASFGVSLNQAWDSPITVGF